MVALLSLPGSCKQRICAEAWLPWLHTFIEALTSSGSIERQICMSIPKGATVSIISWVLQRHSKMWDHPERFDPERFSPDRSYGRSRFSYLPFGIGPRVCLGASLAVNGIMLNPCHTRPALSVAHSVGSYGRTPGPHLAESAIWIKDDFGKSTLGFEEV